MFYDRMLCTGIFFYYLCTNLIINTYVFCFICILLQTLGYYRLVYVGF